MLTTYIKAAMRTAHYQFLDEDQVFYGNIPLIPGVWATGETVEGCRKELKEVLEDWIMVAIRRGIVIPSISGISLNSKSFANA